MIIVVFWMFCSWMLVFEEVVVFFEVDLFLLVVIGEMFGFFYGWVEIVCMIYEG